tara:strand:+ start:372 stop:896 length:525 start_codon:yes stop_codon:yes gene_type:complete
MDGSLAGIDIRTDADAWRAFGGDIEATVERAATAALEDERGPLEVSILLTDDAAIAELNLRWRAKTGPTNVLSFPGDDAPFGGSGGPRMLGDIVVAAETLEREAGRDGISLADHLSHLIVHGMLHLRGYDHETEEDAVEMESRETAILARLGVADPYRADIPVSNDEAPEQPTR